MIFEEFTGNGQLSERLTRQILGKGIVHAYIFEGDYRTDKLAYALAFVQAVLCVSRPGCGCHTCLSCRKIEHGNYEDLLITQTTDKGNTRDEEIARLQEHLGRRPYAGDRNIAIIREADTMTAKAQNRLLKTLEEPPGDGVILLLSNNAEHLIPTIRSRSQLYRVNAFDRQEEKANGEELRELVLLLLKGESFHRVKKELARFGSGREEALLLLDGLQDVYRRLLLGQEEESRLYRSGELCRILHCIEEARRDVQLGVNPAYSIKNMMLKIGG